MMNEVQFELSEGQKDKLAGKNWMATFLLCWGLGCFGAHRFYTGKIGTGFIMLFLSITIILLPVTIIWTFIDILNLMFGGFKHANGEALFEKSTFLCVLYVVFTVLQIFYMYITLTSK